MLFTSASVMVHKSGNKKVFCITSTILKYSHEKNSHQSLRYTQHIILYNDDAKRMVAKAANTTYLSFHQESYINI